VSDRHLSTQNVNRPPTTFESSTEVANETPPLHVSGPSAPATSGPSTTATYGASCAAIGGVSPEDVRPYPKGPGNSPTAFAA